MDANPWGPREVSPRGPHPTANRKTEEDGYFRMKRVPLTSQNKPRPLWGEQATRFSPAPFSAHSPSCQSLLSSALDSSVREDRFSTLTSCSLYFCFRYFIYYLKKKYTACLIQNKYTPSILPVCCIVVNVVQVETTGR
ncbi:unnamed protein product [Arctogadus glacialis]